MSNRSTHPVRKGTVQVGARRDPDTGVVTVKSLLGARKTACSRCQGTMVPQSINGKETLVCVSCPSRMTSRRIG